jgi:hypothetical protein
MQVRLGMCHRGKACTSVTVMWKSISRASGRLRMCAPELLRSLRLRAGACGSFS